jgi:hypothetical protein
MPKGNSGAPATAEVHAVIVRDKLANSMVREVFVTVQGVAEVLAVVECLFLVVIELFAVEELEVVSLVAFDMEDRWLLCY